MRGEGGRVWYRVSFILKLWHVFNVNIYGISSLNCSPSPHLLHLFNPRPTGSHSTGNWKLAARAEQVGHRLLEESPKGGQTSESNERICLQVSALA